MIYTTFAMARQNMRSGKAGVSLLESHIASVILNQKSNLIGCRQHGVAAMGKPILDNNQQANIGDGNETDYSLLGFSRHAMYFFIHPCNGSVDIVPNCLLTSFSFILANKFYVC